MPVAPVTKADSVQEREITEAARDIIVEGGLEALSMRAVAERVGTSATALYHYFDGKQALIERVGQSAFARFGEYMETAMRAHPEGSMERVRALGQAYMSFALENQAHFRVIFSIQMPDPRKLEDLPGGGGYHLLRQAVVEAMEAGTMRRGDPDLAALFLWSTVHGLVTLVLACRLTGCEACGGEVPSPQALFDGFGPFLREGILASRDRNEPEPEIDSNHLR
jgi:AcrR family transcriptional regulator